MFKPKYLKQAKLLRKGVKKFLHYKEDLISPERMEEIRGKLAQFEAAVDGGEKEAIKEGAKTLTKACERAVPPASNPGLRENLEVLFVAVIIAVGIRAYFLQPFRIPTGSMQPTLNGVIAHVHDPATDGEFDRPGFLGAALHKVAQGRTYVDFTIPKGARIESISETTRFKFFTSTTINFDDPSTPSIRIRIPKKSLIGDQQRDFGLMKLNLGVGRMPNGGIVDRLPRPKQIDEDLAVQGWVDTGDQVLVNKFSYHFRQPRRGEVFVFNTRGISGIAIDNPAQGSQHYIKRLCGVPGDTLHIERGDGRLFVDGEPATEEMIRRVWADEEGGYQGYMFVPGMPPHWSRREQTAAKRSYPLDDLEYMALGDNSYNSSDSRMWGPVPEDNLVGPALVVYWPFENWGRIR